MRRDAAAAGAGAGAGRVARARSGEVSEFRCREFRNAPNRSRKNISRNRGAKILVEYDDEIFPN